jgi:hypothetical protein
LHVPVPDRGKYEQGESQMLRWYPMPLTGPRG